MNTKYCCELSPTNVSCDCCGGPICVDCEESSIALSGLYCVRCKDNIINPLIDDFIAKHQKGDKDLKRISEQCMDYYDDGIKMIISKITEKCDIKVERMLYSSWFHPFTGDRVLKVWFQIPVNSDALNLEGSKQEIHYFKMAILQEGFTVYEEIYRNFHFIHIRVTVPRELMKYE